MQAGELHWRGRVVAHGPPARCRTRKPQAGVAVRRGCRAGNETSRTPLQPAVRAIRFRCRAPTSLISRNGSGYVAVESAKAHRVVTNYLLKMRPLARNCITI